MLKVFYDVSIFTIQKNIALFLGEEENMKDDSDSDDVAPRSRGVRRSSTWTKPYPRPATRRPPFICPLCELPFRSMRR